MNLVSYRLAVDRVADVGILDLERSVHVKVKVVATRVADNGLLGIVT